MNQIRVFAGKLAIDLEEIIKNLGKLIKNYAEGLGQTFITNVSNWVQQQLSSLWQQLVSWYNSLVSWINNFDYGNISFESFYSSIQQIALNVKDSIVNFFANLDSDSIIELLRVSLMHLANFICVMFGIPPVFPTA